jgi:hemolysin activation/secretion protein
MKSYVGWVLVAGGLASVISSAWAQRTEAGRVLDSVQPRQPSGRQQSAPEVQQRTAPQATPSLPETNQQIEVREFRIEGATMLSQPRLQKVVEPFAGRSLTPAQMQQAADAVTQTYREAGYVLVQALVLPQPLSNGVVVITVREDRLARVDVSHAASGTVPGVAKRGLSDALSLQRALNVQELEQALLLVNDLPGRGRASAEITPAAQGDASTVSVRYTPAPKVQGSVTLDNAGNRFTGSARAIGQLLWNEPLGAADQMSLTLLATDVPLAFVQWGYRFPVTPRLSLGASASWLDYKLCCQNPGERSDGSARSIGLDAAYHISLKRGENSALFASLDSRRLDSERNSVEQTDRRVDALSLGLRGYTTVGTVRSWNLALRSGRTNLRGNATDLAQDSVARIQGTFSKVNGGFYQLQSFTPSWSWQLQARGQLNTGRNLESSERIALGGVDGVRAYPSGEGVGDHGWLVSTDLRYAFTSAPGLSLSAFVDAGGVRRYSKNVTDVLMMGQTSNRYTLAGAGVGARYEGSAATVSLQVARPIGSNRGADAAGNNNEGRRDGQTQAWLSAAWRF